MAAILLAGILTVFSQRTITLSILKEINTTKYKDFYLTRWRRKAGYLSPLSAFR
jgi:hypothetical protein